jgi:Fic family protein
MWQTLLLMRWKPIFAWLPVETIVKEHQQAYYDAIGESDRRGESTPFIDFMLGCIKESLIEVSKSGLKSDQKSNLKSDQKILEQIRENASVTIAELQEKTGMSESGVKKVLRRLREEGRLKRVGGAKGGHWECPSN